MTLSWFVSPAALRFSKAVAVATTSAGFLMYYLPNGLLIDKFQQVTQLYKDGTPVKMSEKVPPLVAAAMNDLQMSKDKQNQISIYTGYGFDFFHAGSLVVSSKGVLGIPSNFRYNDFEEFDKTGILVNNEPVKWSTAEAQSLIKSLILSDEAKKFAIAREVSHLNSAEPFLNGVYTSSVLFMCYTISRTVNSRLNLYARPRSLRIVWYGLMSLFSYATWILCKDFTCVFYEVAADETAANVSEAYANGGLEFYEKILQRNVALRSLMGHNGKVLYTAYGNDEMVVRTKHMAFTSRRDYMKDRVEKYNQEKEEKSALNAPEQDSPKDVEKDVGEETSPKDDAEGISSKDVAEEISPKDVVEEISPKDVVEEISPKDFVEEISPRDVVEEISPKDVVEEISPKDVVEEISPKHFAKETS